jgi:hypothetical protein
MTERDALRAREAKIAAIEKESLDRTGLRSNIVSLYHDGEYWLYQYKRYTDVRLVMAPERQAAYFGGDSDNFTFPRHDLDLAFFRVYEDGQPIQSKHYLKWSAAGAADGELVFVAGNPGSTNRLYTCAQLEYQRDIRYPLYLDLIDKRIAALREYARRGPEQERRALVQIFGLENSKKAQTGEYLGLRDAAMMAAKKKQEEEFRKQVSANPEWKKKYGDGWDVIAQVMRKQREVAVKHFFRKLFGGRLPGLAVSIVLYVSEVKKPNGERLTGYHDSDLEALRFRLFSPAPVYPDLEEVSLASGLQMSLDRLGTQDPFPKIILNGRAPADVAKELIAGTKLADPAVRKSLVGGGVEAVAKSDDALIVLARKLEPLIRETEEWNKKNIESIVSPAMEKLAQARFAAGGASVYPDATFTLRLSFGAVRGYPMNGTAAPSKTTLYGLYDRSISFGKKGEFALPDRFWERVGKLNLSTPVNFVSTNDIIGGNSGSPVINRNAELVGLVFDGNIESLVGRFVYDDAKNRTVSVHSAYIIEALQKLYDAQALAEEILGK